MKLKLGMTNKSKIVEEIKLAPAMHKVSKAGASLSGVLRRG